MARDYYRIDLLKKEQDALQPYVNRINTYLGSEEFKDAPFSEKTLIARQLSAMFNYGSILQERIDLLERDDD